MAKGFADGQFGQLSLTQQFACDATAALYHHSNKTEGNVFSPNHVRGSRAMRKRDNPQLSAQWLLSERLRLNFRFEVKWEGERLS